MADQFNHDIDVGRPPLAVRKSYAGVLGVIAGLAVIAGVSGLLWANYDHLVEVSTRPAAVGSAAGGEETTAMKDLQAIQRQTSETLLATRQLLDAQQAEVKRLADQVAGLSDKIEQLQPKAAAAPPAPAAASNPALAAPVVAAARAQAKKRAAPKPAGAISVGGAPLPTQPPR